MALLVGYLPSVWEGWEDEDAPITRNMMQAFVLLAMLMRFLPCGWAQQGYIPDHVRTPGAINPNVMQANIHSTLCVPGAQAKLDIVDWIEGFYNHRRMHSSIDYKTPVDVESGLMAA